MTLRTVHDENARALRLEAGRADVAVNLIPPALLPPLTRTGQLFVSARPGANLTYVVVQEAREPLGDASVRQALSMAIDRRAIAATLLEGHAHPAGGLIAPTHWAHASLPPLPFDADGARSLLGRAIRHGARPAGERAVALRRLTLLTSTERLRIDVARVVAQQLGDVGLTVDVVPLELGTMIARLGAGDFDLAILQLPEMTEPNVFRFFLHGAFVPPAGSNRGRVHDAVLDELLDEGDRCADPAARLAVYARFEAREREQMHVLPLWYEDQIAVTSARARAFAPSAEGRWLALAELP